MNIVPRSHVYYVADTDPNLERVTDPARMAAILRERTHYLPDRIIEHFPCLLVGERHLYGVTHADPQPHRAVVDLWHGQLLHTPVEQFNVLAGSASYHFADESGDEWDQGYTDRCQAFAFAAEQGWDPDALPEGLDFGLLSRVDLVRYLGGAS